MEMNVIMDRQANYIACEQASTPTHTNANTQCRHIQQPRYDTILVRGEIKFVVIYAQTECLQYISASTRVVWKCKLFIHVNQCI